METINKKIHYHLEQANELAEKHVEELARNVLINNPKKVSKFMMAMGSFFFIDNNDNIIHESMGNNKTMLSKMKGYGKLDEFISEWDEQLGITGMAMTFTATGKKITDW